MPARHTATFPPLVRQDMTSPSSFVHMELVGWAVQAVSVQVMMALATWPGVGVLPPQDANEREDAMRMRVSSLVMMCSPWYGSLNFISTTYRLDCEDVSLDCLDGPAWRV